MKSVLFAVAASLISVSAFAEETKLECADKAVEVATTKNFKRFGANTGSCGAKLLASGETLETYLVCVSDETDPSEWVVVMDINVAKGNKVVGKCGVLAAEQQFDSETPNFDSSNGILKTVECSMSDDDKKATCK